MPSGLLNHTGGHDALDYLRQMPILALFCGFVKYEVAGTKGVWMRTYGGDAFRIPDFAVLADGHQEATTYYNFFGSVMRYLMTSGTTMQADHTLQMDKEMYVRLREPTEREYFLHGPGKVFVCIPIAASEINKSPSA